MKKKKNSCKITDARKVRNIILSEVRLTHDRSLYLEVSMKEAREQYAKQSFKIQTKRKRKNHFTP